MALLSRQPWFYACRPFEEHLKDEFVQTLTLYESCLCARVDLANTMGVPPEIKWTVPMTAAFVMHVAGELGQDLVPRSFELADLLLTHDAEEPGVVHVSARAKLVLSRAERTKLGRKWMERAFAVTRRVAAHVARSPSGHAIIQVPRKERVCTDTVLALMKDGGLRGVRVRANQSRAFLVVTW